MALSSVLFSGWHTGPTLQTKGDIPISREYVYRWFTSKEAEELAAALHAKKITAGAFMEAYGGIAGRPTGRQMVVYPDDRLLTEYSYASEAKFLEGMYCNYIPASSRGAMSCIMMEKTELERFARMENQSLAYSADGRVK